MKLVLSYDLEDAIKNVREPFGPFKVVRNNKRKWATYLPIYTGIDYIVQRDFKQVLPTLLLQYSLLFTGELVAAKILAHDIYYLKSSKDLETLVSQLESLNLSTDYQSLKKGEVYEKKYHVTLNEDKFPCLLQEKYFLVPTFGFHGEMRETSLLQEHEMGAKEYVLSIGSMKKAYQVAYSQG